MREAFSELSIAANEKSKTKLHSQARASIALRGAGAEGKLAVARQGIGDSEQRRRQIADRRSPVRTIEEVRDEQTDS